MSDRSTSGWEVLEANREAILDSWVKHVSRTLTGRMTQAELDRDVREMFDALLSATPEDHQRLDASSFDALRGLLADVARTRARQGFTATETAISVFALKEAVLEVFEGREDAARYVAFGDVLLAGRRPRPVHASRATPRPASGHRRAGRALLELSTPVVKLWDGVVALPLVGTLDSARTQVVMEKLLQALVDTGSEHAIIDITGVAAVDTQVAQHLLKTVMAARLLGAECIISGIRPADRPDRGRAGHRVRRHPHQGEPGRRPAAGAAQRSGSTSVRAPGGQGS